jgi:hypothetical protein
MPMTHKPTHGGRRPNAGRPISTGSKGTPVVSFRLGKAAHGSLSSYAKRHGISANQAAKYIVTLFASPPDVQRPLAANKP